MADLLANPGDNPLIGRTRATVVEMLDDVGTEIAAEARTLLMMALREKGGEILTSTRVKEILPDGVRVVNTVKEVLPDWTTVTKDGDEERAIGGSVAEVHVIGDAKEPRKAIEAIAEGAEVARAIRRPSVSETAHPRISGPLRFSIFNFRSSSADPARRTQPLVMSGLQTELRRSSSE